MDPPVLRGMTGTAIDASISRIYGAWNVLTSDHDHARDGSRRTLRVTEGYRRVRARRLGRDLCSSLSLRLKLCGTGWTTREFVPNATLHRAQLRVFTGLLITSSPCCRIDPLPPALAPSGQLAGLSHGNKVKLRPTDFAQNVRCGHSLEGITETRNEPQGLKSPDVLHLDDHLEPNPGAVEVVYVHKILRMS